MSHKFHIGEIAIAWCAEKLTSRFNGSEVEIIAQPQPHDWHLSLTGKWVTAGKYVIALAGAYYEVLPENLRKRRPPPAREQTSTWDDVIVWRPKTKETSHV